MRGNLRLSFVLIAAIGAMTVVGCGDSSETQSAQDAAAEATAAAQAAQEQASELEAELDKQQAKIEKQEAKIKKQEAQQDREDKKAEEQNAESQPEPEPEPSSPPDVVGLSLPAAKKALKEAGFSTDATNTDTAFGIIDPSNYTICKQSAPVGNTVPVLAQKYGC